MLKERRRRRKDLVLRIMIYDLLIKREENGPFWKQIKTGNVKQIVRNSIKNKWSRRDESGQSTSKLISIRQEWFFKLLFNNQTINLNIRLELMNNRAVVFHYDITRFHRSLVIRWQLLLFGWKVHSIQRILHLPISTCSALDNILWMLKLLIQTPLNSVLTIKDKKF